MLPEDKAEAVSHFVDFMLHKYEKSLNATQHELSSKENEKRLDSAIRKMEPEKLVL